MAFSSLATTLSAEDDDFFRDVFVRDLATGATTLVSRSTCAFSAAGNGDSFEPSLSGDGRFVAFSSRADNLSPEGHDAPEDVYVRDLAVNATVLVSRASGSAGAGGDADSFAASISADGTRVAFTSEARNLSAEDGDGVTDVFVRDLPAGLTTLASRAAGPAGSGGRRQRVHPGDLRATASSWPSTRPPTICPARTHASANVFRRDVEQVPPPAGPSALSGSGGLGRAPAIDGDRAGIMGTARDDVIRGTPRPRRPRRARRPVSARRAPRLGAGATTAPAGGRRLDPRRPRSRPARGRCGDDRLEGTRPRRAGAGRAATARCAWPAGTPPRRPRRVASESPRPAHAGGSVRPPSLS